jgi:hypothetical protein
MKPEHDYEIKKLEEYVEKAREDLKSVKDGSSVARNIKDHIQRLRLNIRRLKGESPSGLSKDEIDYYEFDRRCYTCREFTADENPYQSRRRLLDLGEDTFVRGSGCCSLWIGAEKVENHVERHD